MLTDRIEGRWINTFVETLALCKLTPGDAVAILSETQSRALTVHLVELALVQLGAKPFHVQLVTPAQSAPIPIRSTGASQAIQGLKPVLSALKDCPLVVDCTVEGLMHASELPEILAAKTRVQTICNEHPDALERLRPDPDLTPKVKAAAKRVRTAQTMRVKSKAGTDLTISMVDAPTVGIWGYADKPGTLQHWPGGFVVSFPRKNCINGTLVLDAGDINLTFKRYLDHPIALTLENDFVRDIQGEGADTEMLKRAFAVWDDPNAYAVSHVGFGMNEAARYEALAMYDQRDTNGTEQRAFAGNFLFSTGANEFEQRFTQGHFDIPVRGCDIWLDETCVVKQGAVQWEVFH